MITRVETEAELWARMLALYAHMIKRGLQSGLTRFFDRATRVALIYSVNPAVADDFLVYDTTRLLDSHRNAIREHFSDSTAILRTSAIMHAKESVDLQPDFGDTLLCFAHQTDRIFYHVWCIEKHATQSPETLIDQWVRFAQIQFLYRPQEIPTHLFGSSERLLEHLAFDTVREVIMAHMFPRTLSGGQQDAEAVLESLLEIATVKEEGAGCSGTLAIYDRNPAWQPVLDYRFRKTVPINNFKYIRKLLTATSDEYPLVAVGSEVIGMSNQETLMQSPLVSRFQDGRASLYLNNLPLCKLINGHFRAVESKWSVATTEQPKLWRNLSDQKKNDLQELIDKLVTSARTKGFGCTVLFDFGAAKDRNLSGHWLDVPAPVNPHNKTFLLLENMCKVDGAVQLDVNSLTVLAFACLLDGQASADEDLSRGARFNSARRYSESKADVLILVVSEDGPVTMFEQGQPGTRIEKYVRDYEANHAPPKLGDWLNNSPANHS